MTSTLDAPVRRRPPLRRRAPAPPPQPTAPRGLAAALVALALGGFAIGTGEFVSMGLLPEIAAGVGTSLTSAGAVISFYALGVVAGALPIAVLGARAPRRAMLIGLMAVFAGGNLLSALAPSLHSLMAARFLAGVPHGAYFGIASLVAASLAGEGRRAWAVARVLVGLSVANIVGVPLGTWLGQALGWRSAFVAVALLAVATVVAVARFVPPVAAQAGASVRSELGALRRPQVWLTLGVGMIGFGGMFAVYTYIAPTLTERAGLPGAAVPLVLAFWGVGMVAGNLVSGHLVDRALVPSTIGILLWIAAALVLFSVASVHPVTAVLASLPVAGGVALVPALQTRLMDVAADAQTLAAALNHAAFNVGNALGAWLGGVAVAAGGGWGSPSLVGAGLAVGGLALLGISLALERSGLAPARA